MLLLLLLLLLLTAVACVEWQRAYSVAACCCYPIPGHSLYAPANYWLATCLR